MCMLRSSGPYFQLHESNLFLQSYLSYQRGFVSTLCQYAFLRLQFFSFLLSGCRFFHTTSLWLRLNLWMQVFSHYIFMEDILDSLAISVSQVNKWKIHLYFIKLSLYYIFMLSLCPIQVCILLIVFCRWLELDLKLVADIGIVGAPNAGKNMFLSVISVDMQCCLTCNVR